MEFRVEVTPRAQQDLDTIYAWVVSSAPVVGLRWFERFENSIASLSTFPGRCPIVPKLSSRRQTIRKLVFGTTRHKYRVFFTMRAEVVTILHVRHGSRRALRRL